MKKLFFNLLLATATAASAFGQAGLSTLVGTVTDASGAAVSGATVLLVGPNGVNRTATTNASGYYQFSAVPVAEGYSETISASGFSSAKITKVNTSVGTTVTQDAKLSIGATDVTVEVAGSNVEQVQTDTSQVSQLVDATIWKESPLNVRDANAFVGLTAGAASDSAGTARGFSVNGARTGAGNFLLEGFDNNDQGLGGGGGSVAGSSGGAVTSLSPDAVQEYRVISSVPNAEYGRAGGFTTDTVLKSGTNKFHGSLFGYNRIQALAQNDWFSTQAGLRDHLVRNQFGGSIGGPIKRDKTYFFATVEIHHLRQSSPTTYTSITQDFYNFVKNGQFQQWAEGTAYQTSSFGDTPGYCPQFLNGATCPGAFSKASGLGAVFQKNYSQTPNTFPFATRNFTNASTDYFNSFFPVNIYGDGTALDTVSTNENRGSLKLDHKLTSKDQLAFTYAIENDKTTSSLDGGDNVIGPPLLNYGGSQIFGARWTHTFTPNVMNDFRAGYLRHVRNFDADAPAGVASTFTGDSLTVGFGKGAGFPQPFTENQFSYEDAITYIKHAHTFKAGFRFARTRNGSSFYNDVNGTLAFWGAPGLLTDAGSDIGALQVLDGGTTGANHDEIGTMYYASASIDPSANNGAGGVPDPYRGYRANEFAAYVQDDWKLTSRLFVNYGVRWDYFGPPHNFKSGIDSNVYFGSSNGVNTANPFAPNVPLLLGEQAAAFKCVGFVACGSGTSGPGYAAAAGRDTIWDRDTNNIGPRVGFSYDALGSGKLVVRGGFGIGYDRLYNNVYENIRFNGPHFVDNTAGYGYGTTGISEALTAQIVQNPFTGNLALPTGSAVPRHVNEHLKTAYYEQAHFGIQTGIKGYVVEANYIGTFGRQLVGLMNANTFEGRTACSSTAQKAACAAAGLTTAQMSTARPNTTFGNDNFRTNGFSSNYNGGQASIRRGYSNGLQFMANYSYSHALDQISDVFTVKGGATGITTPYNPSHSYGNADFDTRHLFSLTLNYRTHSESHKLLLAGWGISPIFKAQSGTPIYVYDGNSNYDPNKDGTLGVEKAVYVGTGNMKNSINHNVSPAAGYIKTGSWNGYTCPANVNSGLWCDVPIDRNQLFGPRSYNLDAAVSKHLEFSERSGLTLQAAFFDIDGHPGFSNPVGNTNSTQFGSSQAASHRETQLSGRIEF